VRVLAELKAPSWSAAQGLPMAGLVADELRRLDATAPDGTVVVQSFDAEALRELRAELGDDGPTLMQLVWQDESMLTPAGLREISTYAQGITPNRHHILLRDADDEAELTGVSTLVEEAHEAGLTVIPWTLRSENTYLPRALRRGENPAAPGNAEAEARLLLALGVDGLITDNPDIAVRARAALTTASIPTPRTVAA
jgi:glycerophosphoryl diester phosphodiesterase